MPKYMCHTLFWETTENDTIKPKCSAIIFKNTGDVPADINGVWRLEPGEESPTISTGHPEVVDLTEYTVSFEVGGAGSAPMVKAMYTQIQPATAGQKNSLDACEKL